MQELERHPSLCFLDAATKEVRYVWVTEKGHNPGLAMERRLLIRSLKDHSLDCNLCVSVSSCKDLPLERCGHAQCRSRIRQNDPSCGVDQAT